MNKKDNLKKYTVEELLKELETRPGFVAVYYWTVDDFIQQLKYNISDCPDFKRKTYKKAMEILKSGSEKAKEWLDRLEECTHYGEDAWDQIDDVLFDLCREIEEEEKKNG